jgi:hypothetical protein
MVGDGRSCNTSPRLAKPRLAKPHLAKPRLVRPSCGEGRVRVASDLRAARRILDADLKCIVLLDKQRRFGSRLCCGARSSAGGCRQKRGAGAMKAQGLGRALFAPAF